MKIKKKFDSVKMMRDIRDKISIEIANLTPEQLKEYFRKRREEFEKKYGQPATPHQMQAGR